MLVSRRVLILLLAAVAFALAMPIALDLVQLLGYQIPIQDKANDYTKAVVLAATLGISIVFLPVPAHDRRNLLYLWGAKAAVCLLLMLFYEWNYGLDAYWYFERSQRLFPDFRDLGPGRGTDNLVAALWYFEHNVVSLGSYHSQKIFCAFLGLGAIYAFYRGLASQIENLAPRALLYLGLFPSVLFWSSILGKDPINLLGSCLFFYGAFSFLKSWNPLFLLPTITGIALAGLIRTWIAPMLVVPLILAWVATIQSRALRALLVGGIVAGLLFALQGNRSLIVMENSEILPQVGQASRSWAYGGSAGDIPELNSYGAMLRFLPIGMFTALFRPLPGEVLNPFGLLAGLENLLVLILLVMAIRKPARGAWRHPVVIALGSFVLIWAMAYAFISPQNLGSAVRFRLQVMPMMIFILLYVPKAIRPRVVSSPRERRHNTEST